MYDAIVIGSGFGGAVTACRLTQKGMKVLVLERGRRWSPSNYPRKPGDDWVFDPDEPERQNGWMDLRFFKDMIVAQGAGVGGGSLIYANVLVDPPDHIFRQGWPAEINLDELQPYLDRVGKMMGVQTIPDGQLTARYKLMKEAAEKTGDQNRFMKLPLAVTFDPNYSLDQDDPFNHENSKTWTNLHGREQGTCVHLGNCDIGCDVKAKNTLDLNYLAEAEDGGAEIRPGQLATYIEPCNGGYEVHIRGLLGDKKWKKYSEKGAKVIIAAGSLNSTEILLRSKSQYKTLPHLSDFLGKNWSSNGDFLTPAFYKNRKISPSQGPTITAAIDYLDPESGREQYFIEDGGFPDLLGNYIEGLWGRKLKKAKKYKETLAELQEVSRGRNPLENMMPWFAQGIDAADGELFLGRKWYAPWKRKLKLDWDIARSEGVIEAIIEQHRKFAIATEGDLWVPPTWSILKNLVTPHPLGGCNMGTTSTNGVVNHLGEVFGYPGLYVADGGIIPEAVGLNPSRTIAALAERICENM